MKHWLNIAVFRPFRPLIITVSRHYHIKEVKRRLEDKGLEYLPLCHGNALSLYFDDPEGNTLEIFFDTPWHVIQPQTEIWDPNMTENQALAWVEMTFKDKPDFSKKEDSKREFVNRT